MGTPGDKKETGKIIEIKEEADVNPEELLPPPLADPNIPLDFPPLDIAQPSTSSSPEMGYLSALPLFETFTPYRPPPAAPPQGGPSLEQAHIEDYFAQTKYYQPGPESLQPLYAVPSKTFQVPDEPGPSGLQELLTAQPRPKSGTTTATKAVKKFKRPQSPRKIYTCETCQRNFVTLEKFNKHQQLHSGSSPYKCDHCKKSFTSKFKLVRHLLIHSDRKPFSCTFCERTFHRKDHLKNHIKVHSSSKNVYVCQKADCRKEYTSLMSYKKHLALHAAEEGSLQCQICSSVFQTKEEIMHHLKIHAGSRTVKDVNEKRFSCEHCDRKFFTKKDVRRHLVVHTGMRDFLCQFCPQRFGRKDHLVRHIKKSHPKNLPSEETIVTEPSKIKKELPETIVSPAEKIVSSSQVKSEKPLEFQGESESEVAVKSEEFAESFFPFELSSILPVQEGGFGELEFEAEELRDWNPDILQEMGGEPGPSSSVQDPLALRDPMELEQSVMRTLLEPSEEKNIPLPGFSETFQSSPPPPPPPPPP